MATYGQWTMGSRNFLMNPAGYAFNPLEIMRDVLATIIEIVGWLLMLSFPAGVFILLIDGLLALFKWATHDARVTWGWIGLGMMIVPILVILILMVAYRNYNYRNYNYPNYD